MLRGAPDYVLRCLRDSAGDGDSAAISMLQLAVSAGYSLTAVEYSIRLLEEHGYIRIERGGPRCPNRYHILPPRQRVAHDAVRAVGMFE